MSTDFLRLFVTCHKSWSTQPVKLQARLVCSLVSWTLTSVSVGWTLSHSLVFTSSSPASPHSLPVDPINVLDSNTVLSPLFQSWVHMARTWWLCAADPRQGRYLTIVLTSRPHTLRAPLCSLVAWRRSMWSWIDASPTLVSIMLTDIKYSMKY